MATDQEVLDQLERSLASSPVVLPPLVCSVAPLGIPCGDAARFAITCATHGHVFYLCAKHRVVIRPQMIVCGAEWFEAVL